jgi:alpha-ribazole phosphatase CobZ
MLVIHENLDHRLHRVPQYISDNQTLNNFAILTRYFLSYPGEIGITMTMRDIRDVLKSMGIHEDEIVSAAMQLYFPHPGVETREKAEAVFLQEMALALSDPNLALLIYAGVLLESEGERCNLPNLRPADYENDLTCLIADEVLGLAIAKYVGGYKGLFDYVRYDKAKPGILSRLGPFMDDVVAGLIGGVSANMYTRAALSEGSLH